jgi:hypothetical protein
MEDSQPPSFLQASLKLTRSDFAEEAPSNVVVTRQLRSAEKVVRKTIGLSGEKRKCVLAPPIGFGPTLEEEIEAPLSDNSFSIKVGVVRGGVFVCRRLPIVSREQIFSQHPRIAQRQTQAQTPGWIAGAGCIAQQCDAILIRMIDPAFSHVEAGERSSRSCTHVHRSRHPTLDALIDEAGDVAVSVQSFEVSAVKEIGSSATIALRNQQGPANGYRI